MRRIALLVATLALACGPAADPPSPDAPASSGAPASAETSPSEETVSSGPVALVGATLIDGTGSPPLEDAVVLIREGRVAAAGSRATVSIPAGASTVDLTGRWITPGLVNAHGHVGGTLGLEGGHYTEDNLLRQLGRYARYGVATVASLGGDGPEGVRLRDAEGLDLRRSRMRVAGTAVDGDSVEEVRAGVRDNVELGVDFIKIRVDDNLGTSEKMSPELYGAAVDAAHAAGLPLAAHVFYLEDAKGLLRAGADFLAHSVRDRPVDDEIIGLFEETGVCLCPTLAREVSTFVYESEPEFFSDPFFTAEADPAVLDELRDPERQRRIRESPSAQAYKEALRVAQANLEALVDAGVTVAMGTDTGPPARFQGYFEHLELELMAEAGLSPEQILAAATRDAAACLGLDELGTLEPGKWADILVLGADPLADVRNLRQLESVWIAGNRLPEAG